MAINQLTERKITTAKPQDKEYLLADGGGLFLRVRPSGSKTWFFKATVRGVNIKRTVGKYPDMTLAHAREVMKSLREYKPSDAPRTVAELFKRWYEDAVESKHKRPLMVKGLFELHLLPEIGNLNILDISRGPVLAVLSKVASEVPGSAQVLLSYLGRMFKYAYKREWTLKIPTYGLTRDDLGIKATTKRRIISVGELPLLLEQIQSNKPFPVSTQLKIWLSLATLARLGEVGFMRFEELDFKAKTWTIPEHRTKNGQEHLIHLNEVALHLLSGDRHSEGFVFEGRKRGSCLSHQMMTADIRKAFERGKLNLPKGPFTPHDLRRTGATMMGELGVDPKVIELCLNHMEPNRVVSTYQLQVRLDDRKQAFHELGVKLADLLGGVKNLPTLSSLRSARLRDARSIERAVESSPL